MSEKSTFTVESDTIVFAGPFEYLTGKGDVLDSREQVRNLFEILKRAAGKTSGAQEIYQRISDNLTIHVQPPGITGLESNPDIDFWD